MPTKAVLNCGENGNRPSVGKEDMSMKHETRGSKTNLSSLSIKIVNVFEDLIINGVRKGLSE